MRVFADMSPIHVTNKLYPNGYIFISSKIAYGEPSIIPGSLLTLVGWTETSLGSLL